MSEATLHPLVLLHVPAGHEVDPQALDDLTRHASQAYGASVLVNTRALPGAYMPPRLLGHWGPTLPGVVMDDLAPRIARVFFTLDWLADVI